MNFAIKTLLAYLCSAAFTVETISMTFLDLVNFYPQISDSINLISMSTTDLSEIKLFQCVPILNTFQHAGSVNALAMHF